MWIASEYAVTPADLVSRVCTATIALLWKTWATSLIDHECPFHVYLSRHEKCGQLTLGPHSAWRTMEAVTLGGSR